VNSSDGALVWNNSVKTVYAYYPSGITFKDVDNGFIKNNIVDDVDPERSPAYGIRLLQSDRNLIDNNSVNDIFNYDNYGLYLEGSSENNITSNIITPKTAHAYSGRDYYVLGLSTGSNNNMIYNNYFANSSGNAVRFIGTNTGNVWNVTQTEGRNIVGGPYTGGNYWGARDGSKGWSETNPVNPTTKFITNSYTLPGGSSSDKDYLPLSYQTTPKPKPTPNAPEAPSCYTECRNCRIHQVCTIEDPINVVDVDTGQYCNECKKTWEACGPEGWTIYREYCDGHIEEEITGPCPTVTPVETITPTATVTPLETPTTVWTPPVIPTPDLPPLPPLGDCCNFTVMNITANETMFIGQKYLVNVNLVNDCGQCWNNTTALWPWNEPAKQFSPTPIWMRNNTCEYQPYTFSFWVTAPDIREDHYTLQYRLYRNNTTCGDIIWFDVNLTRFMSTAQKKAEKIERPAFAGGNSPGTGAKAGMTMKPDEFASRKFSQVPTVQEHGENRLHPQKNTDYRQSVGPEPTISAVVTMMKKVTGTFPPLKTAR
jgi:parallel beta-helix repeat protein